MRLLRALRENGPELARIEARCAERLRESAYLIDPRRLLERTLGRVAVSATWAETGDRSGFLTEQLDEAIDWAVREILIEDKSAERGDSLPANGPASPYAFLTRAFHIDRAVVRQAAVRFNDLSERRRRTFFSVVRDQEPWNTVVERSKSSPDTMKLELQAALRALFLLPEPRDQTRRDGAST